MSVAPVCTRCSLHHTACTVRVPARGSSTPSLLIVGEAPGHQEDRQGAPFVGPSGDKLAEYLAKVGIPASDCRWTNVVRCFPKGEDGKPRRPHPHEMTACFPYFIEEIQQVRPKVIMTFGNTPLEALTGRKSVTASRGRTYTFRAGDQDYVVIPTIHPAAVLYGKTQYESLILQDLETAKRIIAGGPAVAVQDQTLVVALDTIPKVESYLKKVRMLFEAGRIPFVSLDLETWSDDPVRGALTPYSPSSRILCISLSHQRGTGFVIPYRHRHTPFGEAELACVDTLLTECLSEVPIAGHNLFFDVRWLSLRTGIRLRHNPAVFDSLLASRLLFGDTEEHKLAHIATKYASYYHHKAEMHEALRVLPKGQKNMELVDPGVFYRYAAADADAVIRLHEVFWPELQRLDLMHAFRELMVGTLDFFVHLAINGCPIDREAVKPALIEKAAALSDMYDQIVNGLGIGASIQQIRTREWAEKVQRFLADRDAALMDVCGRFRPGWPTDQKLALLSGIGLSGDTPPPDLSHEDLQLTRKVFRKKPPLEDETPVNLQSNPLVARIMFEVLGIKPDPQMVTQKTGAYVTDRDARWTYAERELLQYHATLESIQRGVPDPMIRLACKCDLDRLSRSIKFFSLFTQYMKEQKIYSTYYLPLDGKDLHSDGYVHFEVLSGAQDTGRTTIVEPPQQTYPRGSKAKRAFVTRYQHGLILASDYSQHELRCMACLSGDPGLMEIFSTGQDAHRLVAAKVFNKASEAVTKAERSIAKAVSFGIPYGRTEEGLAEAMNKPLAEAKEIIGFFFQQFGGLRRMIERYKEEGRVNHAIRTPTGRRRLIPILDPEYQRQMGWGRWETEFQTERGYRKAVNTPIQCAASDLTAEAGRDMDERMLRVGAASRIWGFVHDSLLFDTHPFELMWLMRNVREVMTQTVPGRYPWVNIQLDNDFEIGPNWGQLCKVKFVDDGLKLSGDPEAFGLTRDRLISAPDVFEQVSQTDLEEDGQPAIEAVFRAREIAIGSREIPYDSRYCEQFAFSRYFPSSLVPLSTVPR